MRKPIDMITNIGRNYVHNYILYNLYMYMYSQVQLLVWPKVVIHFSLKVNRQMWDAKDRLLHMHQVVFQGTLSFLQKKSAYCHILP